MKKIIISLLLLASMPTVFAQSKVQDEIKALEKQEVEAFVKQDYKTLEKLWDTDLTVSSTKNIIFHGSTTILNLLKKGTISKTELERIVEEVILRGEVAISMGNEISKTAQGLPEKRRYTNIWLKTKSGWKMTASQHSIICN